MSGSHAARPAHIVVFDRQSDRARLVYRYQLFLRYAICSGDDPEKLKEVMTLARLKPWIHGPRSWWGDFRLFLRQPH